MLREIIKPMRNRYTIHIPDEYLNTEVEILVLPFSDNREAIKPKQKKKKSLAGALKAYANSALIESEKERAWAEVAKDKSALS